MAGCDQAVAASVTDDDCVLQDLKLQEALAVRWINRAKQVRKSASVYGDVWEHVAWLRCERLVGRGWLRRSVEVIVFAVACIPGCRTDLSILWLAQCCAVSLEFIGWQVVRVVEAYLRENVT